MPEARDRLSRQEDVVANYSNRRRNFSRGNIGRVNSVAFVLEDEGDERLAIGTPFRWMGTAMVGTPRMASGRGSVRTPRVGRVPYLGRSSAQATGRENLSPLVGSGRGRGRGGNRGRGNTVLPHWYPRTPLRDITAVVRAIERRGAHWEGSVGLRQAESPLLQDRIHNTSASTSAVQLEHNPSMISPLHSTGLRRPPSTIGKVPKILLSISKNLQDGDSCMTPQKKLLENIDTVEKVVLEELRKLKRTPSAKKAEREKRVKTLMSMR